MPMFPAQQFKVSSGVPNGQTIRPIKPTAETLTLKTLAARRIKESATEEKSSIFLKQEAAFEYTQVYYNSDQTSEMTEQAMASDTDTQSIDPNMIARMAEFLNQLGGYMKDMQGWLRSIEKAEKKEHGHKHGPRQVLAAR
jgi:hypothetical protein